MSKRVTVGKIAAETFDSWQGAIFTICAERPSDAENVEIGRAGAWLFHELSQIRAALLAARTVLDDRAQDGRAATPAEVRLAQMLVELDLGPSREAP